jgi:UDP-N-acetylglucosamine--N-acetylmuramyl-(pentapeptide) pyrophosphoryl-undecaprenol N-acetylglucosamine transferase
MKLLLAGGGTAGHIEPALAVGRGWLNAHPGDEILFLGTSAGLETSLIPAAGFSVLQIPKVAIARSLSPSLLKVPFQLISAVAQTMKHLRNVDCAIGFGGYVSGPLYFAAFLKRVPLVIHEQNAKPGWANRLGAIFTEFISTSYPVSSGALKSAELTGLPLRNDVLAAIENAQGDWSTARQSAKRSISEKYGLDQNSPLIFIFGGSQGSQAINKVIAQARPELESSGYSMLHGVGRNNEVPAASHHYRALPYISEMAECYLAADLLIARSGAVTCAEAAALSKYSLFIPLPVGNGEQALNAKSLVESGRAQVINQSDFTSEWLSANIAEILEESTRRSDVGDTSGVNAVDKILHIIERALRGR